MRTIRRTMILVPAPGTSDVQDVTGTSVTFDTAMATGEADYYVFSSTVACWVIQGAAPLTATDDDGSTLVGAGESVSFWGPLGAKLAVIRAGSDDGLASLTKAIPRS